MTSTIGAAFDVGVSMIQSLDDPHERIAAINEIRGRLHELSPLRDEPVDHVVWVRSDEVIANDYNPNTVAPPEMELLAHSIASDGYTQPIVAWQNGETFEVVDGFHRNRVGKEDMQVSARVMGYLPITIIKQDREQRGDRIAATIRHNRARGKHSIDGMAEIVVELKRRNWSDKKIGRELGMDPDEILRLSQITGLAEMFKDREFSEAWEAVIYESIGEDVAMTLEGEEIDEPAEQIDLESPAPGWDENERYLLGNNGARFGQIKARHDGRWTWFIYAQPLQKGMADTQAEAKEIIDNYYDK